MNKSTLPRHVALPLVLATFAFAANSAAQVPTPVPSPLPSPAASPAASPDASPASSPVVAPEEAPAAEPVIAQAPDVDEDAIIVDSRQITAEVERAMAQAKREMELAMRRAGSARSATAREAERAARSMALTDEAMSRTSAEARVAAREAVRASQAEREAAVREAMQDARTTEREKAIEARERARDAQERAREKAQEAREREQEKRESQRDQADQLDELYDEAMESIDEEDWSDALRPLNKLMSLNVKVDAALYWSSYSQAKLNRSAAALASLARLQKEFPASRWAKEGKALEMEVRSKSGQAPSPDQEDDLDLKLMAVSALAQTDPQEALPVLTKILASPTSSRKVRERSLFVLAQIGSEQASTAMAEVARGNSSPELQRKAIQYLGVFGGPANRKVLSDVYASTSDTALRKQILNSFMVSGDKARVLSAAKTEKDPALRSSAVRLLGVMGGTAELSQMYTTATSADEKKDILQALFVGGAVGPVATAARSEKDKEVRLVAVRNLGLMGRNSQDVLIELYHAEADPDVKKEVLNAFFLQGNSTRLVEIAKSEKDPLLKKEAVHWLSLMNSKESRAYMIELLKD